MHGERLVMGTRNVISGEDGRIAVGLCKQHYEQYLERKSMRSAKETDDTPKERSSKSSVAQFANTQNILGGARYRRKK